MAASKRRDPSAAVAPAGVPQRWQKCAPVVIGAAQAAQVAPARAVPQLEQKRPLAAAPQEGQGAAGAGAGAGAGEVTR
jgi:hypothetical protein